MSQFVKLAPTTTQDQKGSHHLKPFTMFLGICLAVVSWPALGATLASERPTNVVLIVSDDQGFGDIGWNNPEIVTPRLDQLAREGVRLDRFYANPICSVTRAAVMTGLATLRTGVNNSSGLDLKYRLLPQAFHDAGYQTWMFGKWHLGGPADSQRTGPDYFPQARGFDYFYGHLYGAIDYYTHRRKDTGELDWQRNGQPINEEGFSTDLLVDDAIGKLKSRDKMRPFLLYLPFNAVHGPLQPPPSAANLPKRNRREVLKANLAQMDAAVGRLLDALDDEELRENTLVLFFSDNGGQLSQGADNRGLRGEKGTTFEGGIRVPAAVRWPGVLPGGMTSQQFISVMDVLPTLCDATGIAAEIKIPLDGSSFWPSLAAGQEVRHPPFVMGNKDVACIDPPWKLVVPGRGQAPLLFDIVSDPQETRDLAEEHTEIVRRLKQHIDSLGGIPQGRRKQNAGEGTAQGRKRIDRQDNSHNRKRKTSRQSESQLQ